MEVAVLSGKGGAGKTLVATNLARVIPASCYIDCDVEEPNGHLFFQPEKLGEEQVFVRIPEVDQGACDGCRECVDLCRFNALSYVGGRLLIFDDLCHSCGACSFFCPKSAIREEDQPIGRIVRAEDGDTGLYTGIMDIGQASGGRIIEALLDQAQASGRTRIVDCPPGTACSVMDSIRQADYCLVVAEPTIFGLDNLQMVQELLEIFGKPFSVIINKSFGEDNLIRTHCEEEGLDLILDLPFDQEIGDINAQGSLLVDQREDYRQVFLDLYDGLKRRVDHEKTLNT